MKEQRIDIALTDIVNAVVEWQLAGADPSKIYRTKILKAARDLVNATDSEESAPR